MPLLPLIRKRGLVPAFAAGFVGSLPAGWTHTRASAAWRFNGSGFLEQASNDTPRLNYDANTALPLGYLHEEQRTQRLSFSRDFTNAAWVKTNCTAVANAVGLDGSSSSGCTLTATAANATLLQSRTLTSALRAGSIYIKRRTGTGGIDITLDGGTTWTALTGLSSTVWIRAATTQTLANPNFGLRVQTNGDSVIIDGAQVEDGPMPTSLIVSTTTADVTRAADMFSIALGSWFNYTEGTLFAEATAPQGVDSVNAANMVIQIDNGSSSSNRHGIARSNGRTMRSFTVTGGTTMGLCIGAATWADLQTMKCAYAYRTDDFIGASSGSSTLATDLSGTLPASGLTTLRVGPVAGSTYFNGHIRRLAYFNRRLTNTEMLGVVA